MGKLLFILFEAALINNFVLSRFLGLCPFIGVSNKSEAALGMGMAVTFVMGVASVVTWLIQVLVLTPLHAEYMQTIFFILVIAGLVQFLEAVINKHSPGLKKMMGIYLPLITTNCAVLGVAILNISQNYNLIESLVNGVGGGLGFMLALILMSGLRERMESAKIPAPFKGIPIAFVTGGIMSMAFVLFTAF